MEQQDNRADYLINMSDEKSKDWGDFKMQKAKEIANKVVDYKLPTIPFLTDEDEVRATAYSVYKEVQTKYKDKTFVVVLGITPGHFNNTLKRQFKDKCISVYTPDKEVVWKKGCMQLGAFRRFIKEC